MEWARLLVTLVTALVAAWWAVWKWTQERKKDRDVEHNRLAALYVMPFLFACEELQSRLYNILCTSGLDVLRVRPDYPYAEETVYLVAQYFAFEPLVLRHTPYGTDATVVTLLQQVRHDFAAAASKEEVDAWCLFRARQRALGRMALATRDSDQGKVPEVVSLLDFERLLGEGAAKALYLDEAIAGLRCATDVTELPPRSRRRLAEVQTDMVAVLEHFEDQLGERRGTALSLSPEGTRKRATESPHVRIETGNEVSG